mmetsp:Transcript_45787/g.46436  ORF Transcript_45787/g.46436 Transcript_45787/m.46436 type:complete len:115 (+) Transcript_45787:68-412(+)
MKISGIIPKKAWKFSQGSVNRPTNEQHKAYLTIKSNVWDKDKDTQIKSKPPTAKVGKSAGSDKLLFQMKGNKGPEKFILWTRDLNDKVVGTKPDWSLIVNSLINLTDKLANAVI